MDTIDYKNHLLQQAFPTVMAPKYSPLPELERGYRYLMAESGLWVEAKPPWGHFRLHLWKSPRPLPYGAIEEVRHVVGGRIPIGLIQECIEMATLKAREVKEWAGWITWSEDEGYKYTPLPILYESTAAVRYAYPELPEGRHLILDLHSHPFDMDRFSQTDDHDDCGGIRFSGVLSFNRLMAPRLSVRLCIEGHFFDMGKRKGRDYETFSSPGPCCSG